MRFYETTDEYVRILEALGEAETDEEREALELDLTKIDADFKGAAQHLCAHSKNLAIAAKLAKAQKEVFSAEAESWLRKEQAFENERKRINAYIYDQMTKLGMRRGEFGDRVVTIQNNAPSLKLIEDKEIPLQYCYPPEPRKKEILEELKAGAALDFAEIQTTESIRIK